MKKIAIICILALMAASAQAACENLIVNGDFGSGMTGWTTDYSTPGIDIDAGRYDISTNPSIDHSLGANYGDHTTGTGNMLAVNGWEGAESGSKVICEQTVTVETSKIYTLKYWLSSWIGNPRYPAASLAQLECYINGASIGTAGAPSNEGVWAEVTHSWDSGTNTSATIQLMDNQSSSAIGDDFAIDDISLSPPCIEKELTEDGGVVEGEIGIYKSATTEYIFVITYSGPAAVVIDTVPAEFEVTGTDPLEDGDVDVSPAAKAKGPKAVAKSATIITWNVPAGENTLTVDIETRESPGKGHRKKGGLNIPAFKPTSCGTLELNDGATAYDPEAYALGDLVILAGPTDPLDVMAVCGVKPCTPENLVVTGGGVSTTLTLTWDPVCDGGYAVVYNIYRDGGLLAEGEAGPTYDDTGLAADTYCYMVEAVYDEGPDEGNESGKSNEDCGTVD